MLERSTSGSETSARVAFNPDRLVSLFGSHDGVLPILQLAAQLATTIAARLALGDDDANGAYHDAHKLKGSAADVGAEELASLAGDLERELEHGWSTRARAIAISLPAAVARFTDAAGIA
jgi:hypothetical protein